MSNLRNEAQPPSGRTRPPIPSWIGWFIGLGVATLIIIGRDGFGPEYLNSIGKVLFINQRRFYPVI